MSDQYANGYPIKLVRDDIAWRLWISAMRETPGEIVQQMEEDGGPYIPTCDWGLCGGESVGWALDCLGSCGDHKHAPMPGSALAEGWAEPSWLTVCESCAALAKDTGHRVLLIAEVVARPPFCASNPTQGEEG